MTITSLGEKPGIARAAEILGVKPEAVDTHFGIVPIDPDRGLYAVQVREDALPDRKDTGGSAKGPFANPRIEPFGPRR